MPGKSQEVDHSRVMLSCHQWGLAQRSGPRKACLCSLLQQVVCDARVMLCSAAAAVHSVPPAISLKAAREEAEMVLFECVKEALRKSGPKPRQVKTHSDMQSSGRRASVEPPGN